MDDLRTAWLQLKAHVDALASEREHYVDFFERSPDPYLVTDRHGRIVEANGAAVDLFERRRRYLRGKPLASFIAPERRDEFRARIHQLAAGSEAWISRVAIGGRRRDVSVRARAMPGGVCWLLEALQ